MIIKNGRERETVARIYRDKRSVVVQNAFLDFRTGALLSPTETEQFTVVQVAESYYIGGFEGGTHRQHCDIELTLVLTGTLTSSADGREERVEKGSAYFSFRGEMHGICAKGSCRFLTLAVNIKERMRPLLMALASRFSERRVLACADPLGLLPRILSEFSAERRPFFEQNLDAMIGSLLISSVRTEQASPISSPCEDRMAEVMNYIDCHYLSICAAEELSRFGYSYHYLCERFKEIYGVTPGAYLLSRRMDHARRLLSEGQSVSAVAQALGYSSPYNFSRAFKRHTGYAPSQYRSENENAHGM